MATATRVTFGVLSRRAITVSIAVILTARIPMLPITRSQPVASGVGNKLNRRIKKERRIKKYRRKSESDCSRANREGFIQLVGGGLSAI